LEGELHVSFVVARITFDWSASKEGKPGGTLLNTSAGETVRRGEGVSY